LEYPRVNSYFVELVVNFVNVELVDETRMHLLASIGTFCLFVKTTSNEKEHGNGNNELMLHFGNNAFSESNENVQYIALIDIQESMPRFANNMIVSGNNFIDPSSINVGPSLPFHPLNFLFPHSFQVVPRVQKFSISTRRFFLTK